MMKTSSKLIRVGHSPDPDDAFMFYAMAKGKIPMQGFSIEHVVEDIESLNQRALRGELEVTAVSCHAYAYLADQYAIMRSGSSVGDQYGPILVGQPGTGPCGDLSLNISGKRIAIPGKLTTAYLTLQLFEKDFIPVFVPFDQILDVVKKGEADYGLVIHEGQITYRQVGLEKVLDLGVWWHDQTGLPLPLGIDVIRRDLGEATMQSFSRIFKSSIEYALGNRQEALEYALEFGRGISPDLGDRFVGMYVNDLTVDLGRKGEQGLLRLYEWAYQEGLLSKKVTPVFIS